MVSRRSLLRGATGLAAAVPLTVAGGEASAARVADGADASEAFATESGSVPDTLAVARGPVNAGTTITPEVRLTQLSVPAGTELRVRTADGWRDVTAEGCPAGADGATGPAGADPATRPARADHATRPAGADAATGPMGADRATSPTGSGPATRPADAHRATGPAGADGATGAGDVLVGAGGVTAYRIKGSPTAVTELNTVDGRRRPLRARPQALTLPHAGAAPWRPRYLSRAAWGADESYRYNPDGTLDTPPAFFGVQTLTVHHSGEDLPIEDPVQHVRGIYYTHAVTNDWGDIGYQVLIDRFGRVFEGVYSDPGPVPVFGPELGAGGRPQMVNGAHVGGFNAGNVGVCLLGNTMITPPTVAAVRSLTMVLALLARATDLDPEGTTNYVNPISGAAATLRTISAHRDWHTANPAAGDTLCCGDSLYAQLPAIRRRTAALVDLLP